MRKIHIAALAATTAFFLPAAARAQGQTDCVSLINATETQRQIPHGLLMAIALTESGLNGRPNPYAMNIGGRAYHARDTDDMIRTISTENARGQRSIDVGCMQINLKYHGSHFAHQTDLLDPATNVNYGASYLIQLAIAEGSWRAAVMDYHNKNNPGRRYWYGCKVWNNYLRANVSQEGYLNCGAAPKGSSTAAITIARAAPPPSPQQLAKLGSLQASPEPSSASIGGRSVEVAQRHDAGTLELAAAGLKLGAITTSGDNHANAFKATKPIDWSGHVHAANSPSEAAIAQSDTGSGFGHVSRAY